MKDWDVTVLRCGIGLLNFTGLGLGYIAIKKWLRWAVHFSGILILILIGFGLKVSENPGWWLFLLAAYIVWMIFDGYRMSGKNPQFIVFNKLISQRSWLLIVFSGVFIFCEIIGFSIYRNTAEKNYQIAIQNYQAGLYAESVVGFSKLNNYFQLSFSPWLSVSKSKLSEVKLLADAQDAFKTSNFAAAMQFTRSYLSLYPEGIQVHEAKLLAYNSLIAWLPELIESRKFTEASSYISEAQKYSAAIFDAGKIKNQEVLASFYQNWGDALRQDKKYEDSYNKYGLVRQIYPSSKSMANAYTASAEVLWEWAIALQLKNDFAQALEKLNLILNNFVKVSTIYAKTQNAIADLYLNWGDFLISQDHYLEALKKYEDVKINLAASSQNQLELADSKILSTFNELALHDGKDAITLLSETVGNACLGIWSDHPSINRFTNQPGKAMRCYDAEGYFPIPDTAIATKPGELRYVVQATSGSRKIQTCPYTSGHSLERYVNTMTVEITNVSNGKTFAKKTFNGSAPDTCPSTRVFYNKVDVEYGGLVDEIAIYEWLEITIE